MRPSVKAFKAVGMLGGAEVLQAIDDGCHGWQAIENKTKLNKGSLRLALSRLVCSGLVLHNLDRTYTLTPDGKYILSAMWSIDISQEALTRAAVDNARP